MDLRVRNAATFKFDYSLDTPSLFDCTFAEFNHMDSLHPEWIHVRDYFNHVHLIYEDMMDGSGLLRYIDIDLNIDIPLEVKDE